MQITSWTEFWKSNLSFFNQGLLLSYIVVQKIFGPFRMWTHVELNSDHRQVFHQTEIRKFGITWYRSHKTFQFSEDGFSLGLSGYEFLWPAMGKAVPFQQLRGTVEECTTRAHYQMPFLGVISDCRTILEPETSEIVISTAWLHGKFVLTEESRRVLILRFHE